MKKSPFVYILSCAATFWTVAVLSVSANEISSLSQGIQAFYDKDYSNAYELLLEAFENDPGNVELNFYLGRAAFESGNYEMAVMAFERILIASPNEPRVKLEIARAFNRLGSNDLAKKYCNEVLSADPPPNVRENILSFLAAIDESEKVHFISGQVTLGYDWNNNVWASPSSRTIKTVIGNMTLTGASAQRTQDTIYTASLGISHIYRPLYSKYYWLTQGTFYNALYGKTSDLDTVYAFGQTGPQFTFEKDRLGFGVNYAQVQQGNDKYLEDIGLQAIWSHIFSPSFILTTTMDLKLHDYSKTSDRDSDEKAIGVEAGFSLVQSWITLGSKIQRETAESKENAYFRYSTYFNVSRELFKDLAGSVSFEYQYAGYDKSIGLFDKKRMEELFFLGCGIQKKLWQSLDEPAEYLMFNINFQHVWANSNIPIYDYKKDLLQFSLSYNF